MKKIILTAITAVILIACKDGASTKGSDNLKNVHHQAETKDQIKTKDIEGTTWRGIEGESITRQYTFLPNGVLRNTWMGVYGDQQEDNDNGTWTQNGHAVYFQLNGDQKEFNLSEIDIAKSMSLADYVKEKKQLDEAEKERMTKIACTKMNNWAASSRELIGKALGVSSSTISFIRGELGSSGKCLVVADTPKGPVRCVVYDVLQDQDTKEYFASLRFPFAVQAACGSLAF